MRWSISWQPHAAGTDRGNPRDAGERHACRATFEVENVPLHALGAKRNAGEGTPAERSGRPGGRLFYCKGLFPGDNSQATGNVRHRAAVQHAAGVYFKPCAPCAMLAPAKLRPAPAGQQRAIFFLLAFHRFSPPLRTGAPPVFAAAGGACARYVPQHRGLVSCRVSCSLWGYIGELFKNALKSSAP